MGRELVVFEPAIEAEPAAPSAQTGAADSETEELEAGIAYVFGRLRSDIERGANNDDAPLVAEPLELEPADLLLAELNRLWAQPLAA